jgi:MFS family permease
LALSAHAAPSHSPALVDPDALPVANGRIELARTTAFAAGPALGGALVGWIGGSWRSVGGLFGAPACLALASAGFLVQAAVILRSPAVRLERQPAAPV